jgi:hypothetical protein
VVRLLGPGGSRRGGRAQITFVIDEKIAKGDIRLPFIDCLELIREQEKQSEKMQFRN